MPKNLEGLKSTVIFGLMLPEYRMFKLLLSQFSLGSVPPNLKADIKKVVSLVSLCFRSSSCLALYQFGIVQLINTHNARAVEYEKPCRRDEYKNSVSNHQQHLRYWLFTSIYICVIYSLSF